MKKPAWWDWELVITAHVRKRMVERRFTETDLREMLEGATGYVASHEQGRVIVFCKHQMVDWEVVLEPDHASQLLIVITAYRV